MSKLKECKHCGGEVARGAVFCPHCGGKVGRRNRDSLLFIVACLGGLMIYGCVGVMSDVADQDRKRVEFLQAQEQGRLRNAEAAKQLRIAEDVKRANAAAELNAKVIAEAEAVRTEADERAVVALRKRMEAGSASAKYSLALRYLDGSGVETNRARAISMLEECAADGFALAASKLKSLGDSGLQAEE